MKIKHLSLTATFISSLLFWMVSHADPSIGIVISMESEAQYICKNYFNDCKKPILHNGIEFYQGQFADEPATLVISGVGLVNSSIATDTLDDVYHPSTMIMIGSAGGINATHAGDVVIGGKVFDLDFGTYDPKIDAPTYPEANTSDLFDPNNNQIQPLVLGTATDPLLQSVANNTVEYFKHNPLPPAVKGETSPTVQVGTITDSSVFYTPDSITEEIKKAGVHAIAFEDIAFLQTCWLLKTKCITFRSVSNVLPFDKSNPSASAEYAGKNATLVAEQYLKLLRQ